MPWFFCDSFEGYLNDVVWYIELKPWLVSLEYDLNLDSFRSVYHVFSRFEFNSWVLWIDGILRNSLPWCDNLGLLKLGLQCDMALRVR